MATVFMKWLERRPETYDRGIRILTLGRLNHLWERVASQFIREGDRVLELGCGTGRLTCRMALAGAEVVAIDMSPGMLEKAMQRALDANLAEKIQFKRMDATLIAEHYPEASFDLIVTSLMLSELSSEERSLVLSSCARLLSPEGRLVILDEVVPSGVLRRLIYSFFRLPLSAVTWLLTRTSTHPLHHVPDLLRQYGFHLQCSLLSLGGSLGLFSAFPGTHAIQLEEEPATIRLVHRVTLKTFLIDLWALFFRIVPPYPKQKPGLYSIGQPNVDSPVFATGNFEITVRRVVKAIDGKLDAWLLVVDSAGINVWCAAGGGFLTTEKIISAMEMNHLVQKVSHRTLILPQLAAVGVDGLNLHQATGWDVHWGPVKADDLPAYVEASFQKTDRMRWVGFPMTSRLEMVSGTLGFYGLMLLIPIAIFWRHLLLPTAIALIALSYFYTLFLPWFPGRDGLAKSIPLTIVALIGLFLFSFLWDPVPAGELFNRAMGITALSVFIAGEFQGMSPLMRGEQANWIPEALIAIALGLMYWLLPIIVGWR